MGRVKAKTVLTTAQAMELKWFCQNVAGVREDMYATIERSRTFDNRVKRLEKTCELIERFLGEKIEPHSSFFGKEDL